VAFYFALQVTMYRYNIIHVWESPYDSGGRLWSIMFTQVRASAAVSLHSVGSW
jgi:hypothetical protein